MRGRSRISGERSAFESALLESMPGCQALFLKEGSREILACNSVARAMGAAPGKTCFEVCAQRSDPCPFCLAPRLWATGERQEVEIEYGGRWYWGVWAPLADHSYVHYIFDITERKRLEEELRLTQFAMDHAGEAIYWLDPSGRHIYVNDALCRQLGYSREELLGMTVFDQNPFLSQEEWVADWGRVKQPGEPALEAIHRRRDGSTFPVEIEFTYLEYDGRLFNCVFARDISERKRAEADYQRLFNEMLDGFALHEIICDETGKPVDYRFLVVNPAFERTTGIMAEQVVGKTVREVLPGLEPAWIDTYGQVALTGTPAWFEEYTGTLGKWFEVTAFQPAPRQFACIFVDVTAKKEAEAALREREEQLRQAQKMEAVGQLAGGIAHDFNNLLTAIIGYSELALADGEVRGLRVRGDIEQIKGAAERASVLTRQILAFSRRQALRPEMASLNAVLTGMEPLLRRTLGEDIDLVTGLQPELGFAEIDVHQIEQVLLNLAVNARDAMPIGGTLTIETDNVDLEEEQCSGPGDVAPGPYVLLSVTDTGVGMGADILPRIFEPFFTTKPPGAGTGLGLSTIYGIIKQSGGGLTVRSEPGRGTTFTVYLPRVAGALKPADASAAPRPSSGGHEAVLLVEDEDALRMLGERVLTAAGYQVVSAADAGEALELLAGGDVVPNVLVTDVVLPGSLQGNDLAAALVERWPGLPVVYMSGYTRDAIVHAGRLDEKVNYIEKPFTPAALTNLLRRVLDESTAGAAPPPASAAEPTDPS